MFCLEIHWDIFMTKCEANVRQVFTGNQFILPLTVHDKETTYLDTSLLG